MWGSNNIVVYFGFEVFMRNNLRYLVLFIVVFGSLIGMHIPTPFGQDLIYHEFADRRYFMGIPNILDVLSNLPFLIVGFLGFVYTLKKRQKEAPYSWIVFFAGVGLVAFGSAYYHWEPTNNTLVWDRLPMTIGFMGLFIGLLAEFINPKIEKYLLIPALITGVMSVVYWHYFNDLRFYYWVQLVPLITIPIVIILFKARYTHSIYMIFALFFYLMAKLTEKFDHQIFNGLTESISGHTIKHFLAAIAIYLIFLMLKRRTLKKHFLASL